jgi:2-(1,2-epoxy-1,2-dihydrophenyl)acetyl-CoA isomerase
MGAGVRKVYRVDTVLVEKHRGWRKFTLNRPEKLNAFTEKMHTALSHALYEAEEHVDCRAVLLTGAGRGFCAGQDLSERADRSTGPPDLGATLDRFYNPLIRRIRRINLPVVCAVNGVAAGAGANIAYACDIVLAAHSARFIQSFVKIGLVPDCGGTYFLPRLTGSARARAMAMLGEPVNAADAVAAGLVWKALPDDALMPEAERVTAELAALPALALCRIKQALNQSEQNTLDQQLDLERDLQGLSGHTVDYAEGVAAFIEKRPARFNRG